MTLSPIANKYSQTVPITRSHSKKRSHIDQKIENVSVKKAKIIKDQLDPVVEMLRQDAFTHGFQQKKIRHLLQVKENGIRSMADANLLIKEAIKNTPQVDLSKKNKKLVDEIAKYYSESIADQLQELIELVTYNTETVGPKGRKLIDFAVRLIKEKIPQKQVGEESGTTNEAMENAIDALVNSSRASDLYKALASAMIGQEETAQEEHNEDTEAVLGVRKTLGELMLVIDRNLDKGLIGLTDDGIDEICEGISDAAKGYIEEAAQNILDCKAQHSILSIQNANEAALLKMSYEMAKLLLMKNGGINTGLKELIFEKIIPEEYQNILAVEDIKNTLSDICESMAVRNSIKNIRIPSDKKVSSYLAIHAALGIPLSDQLTQKDVQICVLSGLLSHIRQAKAGTCFATCFLIKAWVEELDFITDDLIECAEFGEVSRYNYGIRESFPFQTRISSEYLDTLITAGKDGRVVKTEDYYKRKKSDTRSSIGKSSYVWEAPGIQAACLALNIKDPQAASISALRNLPEQFSAKQFLQELAKVSFDLQGKREGATLRSHITLTQEECNDYALYAFGAQTNHPLVQGYEQITVSVVDYFSDFIFMPRWVYEAMEKALKSACRVPSREVQAMYRTLLKRLFLPMIARMRYIYNHNFDDTRVLFNDGNHGISSAGFYGYELWDAGLPKDFYHSDALYNSIKKHASAISIPLFQDYAEKTKWKKVDTDEKFQSFIKEVIHETVETLIKETASKREALEEAAEIMCKAVTSSLTKEMILNFFNSYDGNKVQKKAWEKNRYTIETTPWKFRWGGSPDSVIAGLYRFKDCPSQEKPFNGTQKEVLAKCINYVKTQPEHLLKEFRETYQRIIIHSPGHAYLMIPGEESFQKALDSELPTTEYIEKHVMAPGIAISKKRINLSLRRQIIDFAANNEWYSRGDECDDYERLQLTEFSKGLFIQSIKQSGVFPRFFPEDGLLKLTANEFEQRLCAIAFESRAQDPQIKEREKYWEERFEKVIRAKLLSLMGKGALRNPISIKHAKRMVAFVKNHIDTNKLSPKGAQKLREEMAQVYPPITLVEFRKALVNKAYAIHIEEKGVKDEEWKRNFATAIDTELFKLLPVQDRETIIESGIVTHDSNWKIEIYNCHFMFTVNPMTGKLEYCRYIPDTKRLAFMNQDHWFPSGGHKGHWWFPDNYRVYSSEPLFNENKYITQVNSKQHLEI